MIGKFFYLPKNRKFSIPYRYFDPQKEEMEDRERRIKEELGIREEKEYNENFRPVIKGQFRKAMGSQSKSAAEARRRSNTRLIFLILILAIAFYLYFYGI